MATLTVQPVALGGAAVTTAAASGGGDEFPNNGKTLYRVTNGGGSPITVTFTATGVLPSGAAIASVSAVSVAAGATKYFGPFPEQFFNNSNGRVAVTYSGVTSVTVAAISLP